MWWWDRLFYTPKHKKKKYVPKHAHVAKHDAPKHSTEWKPKYKPKHDVKPKPTPAPKKRYVPPPTKI